MLDQLLQDSKSFASNPNGSLPPRWYWEESILRLERERIFRRHWQFAGFEVDLAEPGSYFTCLIGGFIPILVVKDRSDELRAFLNVCRHRGHLVADGAGACEKFTCPYHGWTYGLDGALIGAPRAAGEDDFDFESLGLVPVGVDSWNGFVFVNPDRDAVPLRAALGEFADYVESWDLDFDSLERTGASQFEFEANWKSVAENLIECYHCPTVHPGYARFAELGTDKFELFGDGYALLEKTTTRQDGVAPYDFGSERLDHRFATFWPNVLFGTLPGAPNFFMFTWIPRGTDRTKATFEYLFGKDTSKEFRSDYSAFFDSIGAEDAPLVQSVQVGLESTLVPPTRLMVNSGERLVRRYHELICDALTSDATQGSVVDGSLGAIR